MFRSGQQVGLYTLIEKLGRGGFGEVWLAEKRSQFVTKKVAVKLPHEEQVNFDAITQEATLWEQASGHPNVLPIIDADIYDGQVVIVSEYADGGSLADRLKREEKLSVKQSVELAIGILSGLEFLHSRKIIHRDIKPQNILLQGNTPRLADFGISRAMNTTVVSSAIIGTDAYMSPESFDGKRNAQTDIWSVGVVLYQLLKGSLPFPQEHPSERMFAVLTKEFEPLSDELPSDLRRIVQKALVKQPEHRYQTAEEMREDLQKALIGIAHPTFAKTELLIKPDLAAYGLNTPVDETNEQTIQSSEPGIQNNISTAPNNFQTDATEIQTVVSAPVNQAAETQPAYQQNSFVTEIKQNHLSATPSLSNDVSAASEIISSDKFRQKGNLKIFEYGVVAVVGLILFVGLVVGLKKIFSTTDPLQQQIQDIKKDNPYFVYTDAFVFEENKKFGFKNSKDIVIIPAKYEAAYGFIEGLALVKLNGKFGFIDEKDNVVIPIKFDDAMHFSEGFAYVRMGDYYKGVFNFIDKKGNIVFNKSFEGAESFAGGMAAVKSGGKYGFIDRTGKEVIPFKYGAARGFDKNLGVVCLTGYYSDDCALIDKTGKEITPFKYDYISVFISDTVSFIINNKYGFLDRNGKEIIPAKYDYVGFFDENGYAEAKLNGRKLRIDKYGSETDIGPAETPGSMNTSNTTTTNSYYSNTTNSNTSSYSGNSVSH